VSGALTVPGDKSISHRALMLGALARGTTAIGGFLEGEDCLATARALAAMGVAIERPGPTEVRVRGVGRQGLLAPAAPLDMGNAGTAMRLMMGLLAGQPLAATLIGDASLMQRPMERVAAPLRLMGAQLTTQAGRAPVRVNGNPALSAIDYTLPVASAQVKSALLLAALNARGHTRLTEPAPSRDHTELMLRQFGVVLEQEGLQVGLTGGQELSATRIEVPADFSSAAFFLVAGCLAAAQPLTLLNVGINPTRTGLLTILRSMGADIRVQPRAHVPGTEPRADLQVRRSALRGIAVPEALVPLAIDELPVLFIAAACASGPTVVRGAAELRLKESDRLAAMAQGLRTLGIELELASDGLTLQGAESFGGGTINSRGDHRIAMAFAVAALRARAPLTILDVANVATSFPGFLALARTAGLQIEPA
jgi:3-phosphoshikimate 1-carboxyvinyltransferase